MENISSEDSNSPNKLGESLVDKLRNDLGTLLASEEFADVIIQVEEGRRVILAHSHILAARSKVFAGKIRHSQGNDKVNLQIDSYSFEVITALINFVYTCNTSNISHIADELLQAAEEYELLDLKSVCEKKCLLRMNVDTVVNLLCIAHMHKAEILKFKAMEYIEKNFDKVKATEGWIKLKDPELIKELCGFIGSPSKRFRASTSND